ncbi:MAG: hypothetical protein HY059_22130 [Proteobacteria bacterium]|nr:hypothetical protein [Pseudomonadota bacterium]
MNAPSKDIQLDPDSMIVYQPRWVGEGKTRIRAIVRGPDGRFGELEVNVDSKRSSLLRDILCQYSEAEIDAFTSREARVLETARRVSEETAEDKRLAEEREIAFQAKTKALALDEVKNCPDPRVLRKIRKSKSAFEVAGWLAVAFIKSLEKDAQS